MLKLDGSSYLANETLAKSNNRSKKSCCCPQNKPNQTLALVIKQSKKTEQKIKKTEQKCSTVVALVIKAMRGAEQETVCAFGKKN